MNHVRVYGDPFGEDAVASRLRSFLRLAVGSGMRCSLALGAVDRSTTESGGRGAGAAGERRIPLTDGVSDFEVATNLPPAEIELLLRAADEAVATTAPVVVFARGGQNDPAVRLAGLEWPDACVVIGVRDGLSAVDVLERVRAELRWAGADRSAAGISESELAPWLALPCPGPRRLLVHPGSTDGACGTDLVLRLWHAGIARSGLGLRLVLPEATDEAIAAILAQYTEHREALEITRRPLAPDMLADAAAVLMPWRRARSVNELLLCLASGRPVCVSRFAATAPFVAEPGMHASIGGSCHGGRFEPEPTSVLAALEQVLGDDGPRLGQRARRHVQERFVLGRPIAAAPPPVAAGGNAETRPTVVLEAPFFETSSSAELSIETARELHRRGRVDLRLVARAPFQHDLRWLRERAPELEPLLTRQCNRPDLWLAAGWPVRADRPDCERFWLRVDWEYGSLPVELTPHVSTSADGVVVHSDHVRGAVEQCGREPDSIAVVPHGVDAVMHEDAPPDPAILEWKGNRPVVLFCGGLVWRKGFDVFLRTVLQARREGVDFAIVIKTVGHERHYGGFHLRELVEKFRRTPDTPPLLVIDDDLSRSELAGLYRAVDVLFHPYRGEGFCLPVLEARAAGLPVIATADGATEQLMSGPGAYRIRSARRPVDLPGAHVGQPWVLEPDPAEAARLLVDTLRDLPARTAAARQHAATMQQRFSWCAAAERLEELAFAARSGRMGQREEASNGEPENVAIPRAPGAADMNQIAPPDPLPVPVC
ncbi:MAG: glycosyltransferase family 4 protein [bacterium]|nr:glycosyltransferase family 4 protein [bacterium]